jgi:hypothetical protein
MGAAGATVTGATTRGTEGGAEWSAGLAGSSVMGGKFAFPISPRGVGGGLSSSSSSLKFSCSSAWYNKSSPIDLPLLEINLLQNQIYHLQRLSHLCQSEDSSRAHLIVQHPYLLPRLLQWLCFRG